MKRYPNAAAFKMALEQKRIKVLKCVEATFERYKTHPLPNKLETPPKDWGKIYQQMADEIGFEQNSVGSGFKVFSEFWRKVSHKKTVS